MKSKELKILIFFVLAFSIFTTSLRTSSPLFHFGDSGQNYKILNNTFEFGYPYNDIWPSIYQLAFIDQIGFRDVDEEYFKDNLFKVENDEPKKNNHLFFHSYLILYLLAPLVSFVSAPIVLNFLNCFSFISLLGLAYYH